MSSLIEQSAERPHHPRSPSSLQMREACPRFEPENNETEASKAGTLQHDAFESGDYSRLTDEQNDAVILCRQYVDEILAGYDRGQEPETLQEIYLPIDDKDTTAGWIDLAIVSKDRTHAHLIDLKFGLWPVEPAENNLQGIAYTLALKHRFPTLKEVKVHFLMPYQDKIDTHTWYEKDFPALYLRTKTVVARSMNPEAEERPNIGTCIFCARIGECEALARTVINVGKKYAPIELPKEFRPTLVKDATDAAHGMRLASLVKKWAEAFKGRCAQLALEDDNFIPEGYKLVAFEAEEVGDVKKAEEVARQYLTEEEIDTARSIVLTPLRKALSAKSPRGAKKTSVEALDNALRTAGALKTARPVVYLAMVKGDK